MSLGVVVTAAGSSRRMGGGNKLLRLLQGQPVLVWAVRVFEYLSFVDRIVVSAPAGQEDDYRRLFAEHGFKKIERVVNGGAERQNSIFEALKVLKECGCTYVAVHDGARPLVTSTLVTTLYATLSGFAELSSQQQRVVKQSLNAEQWQNLLDAHQLSDADLEEPARLRSGAWQGREGVLPSVRGVYGVIPGVAVKDTIKRIDGSGFVVETPVRAELVAIQTPQLFVFDKLFEAYEKAAAERFNATDDAGLIERYGGRVRVAVGDYRNIKVTTAEDLTSAETFLEEVREGVGTTR